MDKQMRELAQEAAKAQEMMSLAKVGADFAKQNQGLVEAMNDFKASQSSMNIIAEVQKLLGDSSSLLRQIEAARQQSSTEALAGLQKQAQEVQKLLNVDPLGTLELIAAVAEAQKAMKIPKTDFEMAMELLKTKAAALPTGFEFEIPQVIGSDVWSSLDRSSKLALGKHVKASQDAYGLEFVRKSSSNHAIYTKKKDD